jgi:hypothetical protein
LKKKESTDKGELTVPKENGSRRNKENFMIEITPSRISEADDERESSMVKNQEIFTLTVSDWQNTSEFQAEFGNIETGTLEANSKTSKANVNEESEDLDEIEKLERELEEQMLEEELRLQKELEDQLNLKLE